MRSLLFVPADRPERFARAAASLASAVILDLEDGVPPAARPAARAHATRRLDSGNPAWVRVNDVRSDDFRADVEALRSRDPALLTGVVLAKTEGPEDIDRLRDRVGALPVLPLIESALGIERCESIAVTNGVRTLAFEPADLRLDAGLGDDPLAWAYPRSRLVFAARAAGRPGPLDGPSMHLDNPEIVSAEARRARTFGFGGKLCVHPAQVPAVNVAFAYTVAERQWARRVLDSTPDASGAVGVDGEMINRPRILLAQTIMAASDE